MTSLGVAIERLRSRGQLPDTNTVSTRDLIQQVRPEPRESTRALILKVLANDVAQRPYSVILCRFKDEAPNPAVEGPIEKFFREVFMPGTGGLVEYWREASLGAVDITGSRVFDWLTIDLDRSAAGGIPRDRLVDIAIAGAQQGGKDPINGFFLQVAVFSHNWTDVDDSARPGSPNWTANDPLKPYWGKWIEGSADGSGRISAPPHGHSGNFLAHEMGHGLGMGHDVGPSLETGSDYSDPCCIMSQQNSFTHPRWNRAFGPAVCLPHLQQRNWMYGRRLYADDGAWMGQPEGISLPLSPISRPLAHANLGIKLSLRPARAWDYFVEYVIPTGWNQGLRTPYVFIRRIVDIPGAKQRPAYLTKFAAPTTLGASSSLLETSGNTLFEAQLVVLEPPILRLTATKKV